jgi:hypothetical protein
MDTIMNKALTLLLSAAAVAGVLSIPAAADAQTRFFGPGRVYYYPLPPPGAPGWRETPMYAPDAPPPRRFDNPGLPDFQLGSRSGN